ncbi:ATP/GTP-binding protein [Microcoleus sp. bin38.metabat.b11b12b14.051]|uniref:AAA family ATPase n=1 Tax=Microcoleus sp. bin38.metabat.b11b12b14.051 TaxID=2742709 RepID=UPI0025DCA3E1|nr:ATP-binding protein [Microcoleus sp. bin38.metabat.b11b12b14.051]
MLKQIEIQNFRCFEKIKISGFERVNLIGGKNNAGKTALLEALVLYVAPKASSIEMLRELRRESSEALKAMPKRAWDNLFHLLEKNKIIVIIGSRDNYRDYRVEIVRESLFNIFTTTLVDKIASQGIIDSLPKDKAGVSVITIKLIINEEDPFLSSLIASSSGSTNIDRISLDDDTDEVAIIPSFIRISGKELTAAYDRARLDEKDSEVLKAFQVIDPAIESVESFSIGEPTLYLRRKGESRLPLSLFGDAINRVADIILKLVNSEHKILLIDEIENGIHYTNQRDFWRIVFRLAVEMDTQIFATTHSLEMLQAFADVGLEFNQKCSSAYFELARKLKTNQIIASRLDLETLNYALEHQEGVRGE